jgi:hypothetical protein
MARLGSNLGELGLLGGLVKRREKARDGEPLRVVNWKGQGHLWCRRPFSGPEQGGLQRRAWQESLRGK